MTTFRSIEEVEKHYFPDSFRKKQWEMMTPEQKGNVMAKETIKQVKESGK